MAERYHSLKALGRPLAIASVVLGLALVGGSQLQAQRALDQVDHEEDVRAASQCVSGFERVAQIRDAVEFSYRRNVDTLLSFVTPDTPEEEAQVARYRELVEGDVVEIRATVEDPACNLRDAKRLLAEET